MASKTALVTGGAVGIGASISRTLAKAGYRILLHYGQSESQAQALAASLISEFGCQVELRSADLSHAESLSDLCHWVKTQSSTLDLLVNNASMFFPTPWCQDGHPPNLESWDQLFNINAKAPYYLCHALLPELIKAKGSIVNIIDIHAENALSEHPAYSASKAALKNLTLSFAKDMGHKVRANGVSPGAISWPENGNAYDSEKKQAIIAKVPQGKLGDKQDIANAVLFLAESHYINGHILNVDGGRLINC